MYRSSKTVVTQKLAVVAQKLKLLKSCSNSKTLVASSTTGVAQKLE
jgi:hypothetical protein